MKDKKLLRIFLLCCIIIFPISIIAGCSKANDKTKGNYDDGEITVSDYYYIRFENDTTKMELGESFSIPSVYVYEKGSGKIVAKDVEMLELTDPSGNLVNVSYNTIIPTSIGNYKGIFESPSLKIREELTIPCNDTIAPEIVVDVPSSYYIRKRGNKNYTVFDFPNYLIRDYSGIDDTKTSLAVTVNGENVNITDGKFVLTESGKVEITIKAADKAGNQKISTYESVALEPFEDAVLDKNVLSDFNEREYVRTLSYGYAGRSFNVEWLESYTDSANVTANGVIAVSASGNSTCDIMFGDVVSRDDVDYIDLRLCLINSSIESSAINPYNIAVGEPNKMFLLGKYTKAYLKSNVWTTVRVSGKEYLDMLTHNGEIETITINILRPIKDNTMLYIDEISYGKHYTDTALQNGVEGIFDNDNYKNNIVEFHTKDSAVTTSANNLTFLENYKDDNNVEENGVVKVDYYGALGDITTKVVFAKPVLRSDVGSLFIRIAQTGCVKYDEIIQSIMVTSPLDNDIWGVPYQSFELKENEWTTIVISNKELLDALTDDDGYISSVNITHFRKTLSAEYRTLYVSYIVSAWEDNEINENLLCDYDETEYFRNVSAGAAVGTTPKSAVVIDSYMDSKGTSESGVIKITPTINKEGKFDFSVYFGKKIKLSDIGDIIIRIAQINVKDPGTGLRTFFVTTNTMGNDIWTEDGRYSIHAVIEDVWTDIVVPHSVLEFAVDENGDIKSLSIFSDSGPIDNTKECTIYISSISYTNKDFSRENVSPYNDTDLTGYVLADFSEADYINNVSNGIAVLKGPSKAEILDNYADIDSNTENGVLEITINPTEEKFGFAVYFGKTVNWEEIESIDVRICQKNIKDPGTGLRTFFVTSNTENDIWTDDGRYCYFAVAENTWSTITIPSSVIAHAKDEEGNVNSLSFFCDSGLADVNAFGYVYISEITFKPKG